MSRSKPITWRAEDAFGRCTYGVYYMWVGGRQTRYNVWRHPISEKFIASGPALKNFGRMTYGQFNDFYQARRLASGITGNII